LTLEIPERMRAVVQHGPKDLRVEQRSVPEPAAGEVLVRVQASGICGSDLHTWREMMYGPGIVMGHEIAGEVVALGSGVTDVPLGRTGAIHSGAACGQCARCCDGLSYYCKEGLGLGDGHQGGLCEYVVAPASCFLPAPPGSEPACVAFAEPLANGLRALRFAASGVARRAVVIGMGPIGLSCLVAARELGVEHVVAIEARPRRREAALALGAERVLDPGAADLQPQLRSVFPHGADLVIEAVGLPDTIRSAIRWARPGGTVLVMGVCLEDVELRPIAWLLKELTIRASLGCSHEDQREALGLLSRGSVDASRLVTRRIGIEEVAGVMPALSAGADEIKVVVEHEHG